MVYRNISAGLQNLIKAKENTEGNLKGFKCSCFKTVCWIWMGKNTQSPKPPDLLLPIVHDKAVSDTAQLKGSASCFPWAFKSTTRQSNVLFASFWYLTSSAFTALCWLRLMLNMDEEGGGHVVLQVCACVKCQGGEERKRGEMEREWWALSCLSAQCWLLHMIR